jgi:acetylornithine deacetylase/succinyl-diaminopimelate desuccinylase-like protein
MINNDRLAEWVSRLVQIPSVSPDQAGPRAGVAGEARLSNQVAEWFEALGGQVFQHEVLPDRSNTYGLWTGRSERWFGVDVHMDTVSVEQMSGDPFSGHIREGRVYGRGAVDTKATLGVVLALLEHLRESNQTPAANLLIAATIDEEIGMTGAPALAQWVRDRQIGLDQLIVAEPTQCVPVYGHKGVARLELSFHGKSTHSSQPELGQNAIAAAAKVILAMVEEHARLRAAPPASVLGPPALTVTKIEGGEGVNVVPEHCRLILDRRVVAGESAAALAEALHQLAQAASPVPVSLNKLLLLDAFLQAPDTPWLQQLAAWSGQAPQIAPYGTNVFAYIGLAQDCVVLGPGSIDQAHGAEEWVEISELARLAEIYGRWWDISR